MSKRISDVGRLAATNERFAQTLERWNQESMSKIARKQVKHEWKKELAERIRKSTLDEKDRTGEMSLMFRDYEDLRIGQKHVQGGDFLQNSGTEIQPATPDSNEIPAEQSIWLSEKHPLRDEGHQSITKFNWFRFRDGFWSEGGEGGLPYVFRASRADGEVTIDNKRLFNDRFHDVKHQRRSREWEVGKNILSDDQAIKKMVSRAIERQKFAKDEASKVLWPHHREAAEKLASTQVAKKFGIGRPSLLSETNRWLNEKLIEAASKGDSDRVQLLLHHGADVDFTVLGGTTALHAAADRKSQKIIRLLLEAGSDVNALDSSQQTPLDIAAAATLENTSKTYDGILSTANIRANVQVLVSNPGWIILDGGGGSIWGPPLFAAASAFGLGYLPAVQALILQGASREWAYGQARRGSLADRILAASEFDHNLRWRDGPRLGPSKPVKLIQAVAIMGSEKILEWLLKEKMYDGEDPQDLLQDAVWLDNILCAQVLLAYCGNVRSRWASMREAATQQGRSDAVAILQKLEYLVHAT